jgi:hypothetical protein
MAMIYLARPRSKIVVLRLNYEVKIKSNYKLAAVCLDALKRLTSK